jgi:hypothetical protein
VLGEDEEGLRLGCGSGRKEAERKEFGCGVHGMRVLPICALRA